MSQPTKAQTVSQRLEDIERHLRTDAANQNLERFDHNYVFNRHDLDRVTDTYFKHVPYDGTLVLACFRIVENQPLIFAVYENYEKSGVDLFGGDSLLGHTVYLRLFEKERPIVKSWALKGDFVLFKLIQDTFDKVSNATPSGQTMNWGGQPAMISACCLLPPCMRTAHGRVTSMGPCPLIRRKVPKSVRCCAGWIAFAMLCWRGSSGRLKILIGSSSRNDFFS